METYSEIVLSLLIFTPIIGVVVLFFIDKREEYTIKAVAFSFSFLVFILSLPLFFLYDFNNPEMQFVYKANWIKDWGAYYNIGIDGISMLLILLTTFMMPLAVVASWKSIHFHVKGFMVALLLLDAGMVGVFMARDLLLFYVFWEAMLIPMYLIIGIWGHDHRIKAAVTFFIYTMAGSLFMLVGIIYMYFQTAPIVIDGQIISMHSFAIEDYLKLQLPHRVQYWLFLAFALAFAVKVPMFPFHTWLPLAHVEAPTAGSVDLAAILLKMGPYGFMRFCIPFFPSVAQEFAPVIIALALIGIIYGALVAMVQTDAKKLVAYSSVSHLGFVMLGIFSMNIQAWQGAMMIMIGHGISTSALFLMIGMLYDRRHTRTIDKFGGLWKVMPIFSAVFLLVCFSSLGLPGTNGFVGEFLVLLGAFNSTIDHARIYSAIAMTGVILGAVYLLWMYQRVSFGEIKYEENKKLWDFTKREYCLILPFVLLIFLMGIYPKAFTEKTEATLSLYLKNYHTAVEINKDKKAQPNILSEK